MFEVWHVKLQSLLNRNMLLGCLVLDPFNCTPVEFSSLAADFGKMLLQRRRSKLKMEGLKGKWLQTSAELYDEFLKV